MEIFIGLVILAGMAYWIVKNKPQTTTKQEEPQAPYKVEVSPVIVTDTAKPEAAEKPTKAKKPKAPAKAKPTAEAKEVKPKAPRKPKMKVVK